MSNQIFNVYKNWCEVCYKPLSDGLSIATYWNKRECLGRIYLSPELWGKKLNWIDKLFLIYFMDSIVMNQVVQMHVFSNNNLYWPKSTANTYVVPSNDHLYFNSNSTTRAPTITLDWIQSQRLEVRFHQPVLISKWIMHSKSRNDMSFDGNELPINLYRLKRNRFYPDFMLKQT